MYEVKIVRLKFAMNSASSCANSYESSCSNEWMEKYINKLCVVKCVRV